MPRGKIILVVDCCATAGSLSHDEFVLPVESIVRKAGFHPSPVHYMDILPEHIRSASGAIICGTALMDNAFSDHLAVFSWIPGCHIPVMGICAGMEAMVLSYGGELTRCEEIGMTEVSLDPGWTYPASNRSVMVFELHRYAVTPPPCFTVLAASPRCIQAVRHRDKPHLAVMFHPEVRNEWVIEQFLHDIAEKDLRTDLLG
jgi:GMP synthase (glutamine-hydrolysing)